VWAALHPIPDRTDWCRLARDRATLTDAQGDGRPREWPTREIINAISYVTRTGCWRFAAIPLVAIGALLDRCLFSGATRRPPSSRASLGRVHWSVRGRTENCVPASSLLDYIEGNGVRVVIIEDASRFARDLVTQELGILALIKREVRVITANGDDLTDNSDPSRTMMRQIAGAFMQYEKARLVAGRGDRA
jgi:hypothetical protein